MLSYNEAFYELRNRLQPLYDEREAAAIAHEVMEHITRISRSQRLIQKDARFTAEQQGQFNKAQKELMGGKPLQYVTGTAWFMGRQYCVNEHVLIPRPETEELVSWIIEDVKNEATAVSLNILDIGTGSGCIPISLKLALPEATITTCDISEQAIAVAKPNAGALNAQINFLHLDFLDSTQTGHLGIFNIIVSNPPYIPRAEKEQLHTNVRDYEPAVALFVPDADALIFFKAIAKFGKTHLAANGYIYCEIDAGHADDCLELFESMGYMAELKKDMHGNWRMIKALVK